MDTVILLNKFQNLPDFAQKEVADFVDYISKKYSTRRKSLAKNNNLKFEWEGAIADYSNQYTSVELQHKAKEWRNT